MKEAVEMAQGNQSNRNRGRYGQDFSAPPKQGENETRADYNQRLKEWQRRRSMRGGKARSEEHTSKIQSPMRIAYGVFCMKKSKRETTQMIIQECTQKNTRRTQR